MENNLADRNLLIIIITRYVSKIFFNKDRYQAVHWMANPNVNFNGISPKEMIMSGHADQVWSFIENRIYDLGQTD